MKRLIILTAAVGVAMSLSACQGHSHSNPPPTPTPKLEDKFGTAFGNDFRASPNATPAKVSPGDVIPVDPAAKPTALQ